MSPARLLLIDNNASFLNTTADLLQPKFDVIAVFQDGAAALRQVLALSPDVILLEVSLGDYNGFEIARRIRGLDGGRDVVLVGLAGSEMLRVWRNAGFAAAAEVFADRRYDSRRGSYCSAAGSRGKS